MTVKQSIDLAIEQARIHRDAAWACAKESRSTAQYAENQGWLEDAERDRKAAGDYDGAAREFSLVITSLEDAKMRYTRGRCMAAGVFAEVDIDLAEGMQRAVDNAAARGVEVDMVRAGLVSNTTEASS